MYTSCRQLPWYYYCDVRLYYCDIRSLWQYWNIYIKQVQFDKTIVLSRKHATGSMHDYIFCYRPLMGILFEKLRIKQHTNWSFLFQDEMNMMCSALHLPRSYFGTSTIQRYVHTSSNHKDNYLQQLYTYIHSQCLYTLWRKGKVANSPLSSKTSQV